MGLLERALVCCGLDGGVVDDRPTIVALAIVWDAHERVQSQLGVERAGTAELFGAFVGYTDRAQWDRLLIEFMGRSGEEKEIGRFGARAEGSGG